LRVPGDHADMMAGLARRPTGWGVVLSMPMEAVLKQVNLPPLVDEALLHQQGKYAPYLDLAIACEQSDNENVAALAHAVGLDIWRVNGFHIDAMLWAQQIGE